MNSLTESPPAIVDLRGVSFRYSRGGGLHEVDFRVLKGELVAIEGPTGAGKTTLVHLLSGVLSPQSGHGQVVGVFLGNEKAGSLSGLRRQLGLVFQEEHFLERETVLANVAAPLAIDGKPLGEQKARAMKMLVEVGLARSARRRPTQLSGGEKARLQIARALIREPKLLIADEPFAHLDSVSASEVASLILRAHQRGATVLVMTNRQDSWPYEARKLTLEGGRLRE